MITYLRYKIANFLLKRRELKLSEIADYMSQHELKFEVDCIVRDKGYIEKKFKNNGYFYDKYEKQTKGHA